MDLQKSFAHSLCYNSDIKDFRRLTNNKNQDSKSRAHSLIETKVPELGTRQSTLAASDYCDADFDKAIAITRA